MIAPADQPRRTGITDNQRRALFAWAHAHGKTHDDLRKMTPKGSISSLSFMEAHALLDRLNGRENKRGPTEPRPPGRVNPHIPLPAPASQPHAPSKRPPRLKPGQYRILSTDQADEIERLSAELKQLYKWDRRKFCEWLEARHYAGDKSRPMTNPQSSRDGMEVIRLLRAVVLQARTAKAKVEAAATETPPATHRRPRLETQQC